MEGCHGVGYRQFADEFDEKEDDREEEGKSSWDDESTNESSAFESLGYDRGCEDTGGEDVFGAGIKLSEQDEQRLLGAFLLAADGGLDEDGACGDGRRNEEVQLPTDGPTCLKKFTTIAASLGLKTTREKLREDFEKVVRSNGLVQNTPTRRWGGVCDTEISVIGFTYKVFRKYYLAKIQGELSDANIRQAWDDLHYGTGGKRMSFESSAGGSLTPSAPCGQQRGAPKRGGSGGRAYVTRAELQKILTREGEALTDEEVDELLRECKPDAEGRVVYEGYRRMLIDPSL